MRERERERELRELKSKMERAQSISVSKVPGPSTAAGRCKRPRGSRRRSGRRSRRRKRNEVLRHTEISFFSLRHSTASVPSTEKMDVETGRDKNVQCKRIPERKRRRRTTTEKALGDS